MKPELARQFLILMCAHPTQSDANTWFDQNVDTLSITDLTFFAGLSRLFDDNRKFGGDLSRTLMTYLTNIPIDSE